MSRLLPAHFVGKGGRMVALKAVLYAPGGLILDAGQIAWVCSRQRSWAPKYRCLAGEYREIHANCGTAVSMWTAGTTAG
jgi:hypothetical protein